MVLFSLAGVLLAVALGIAWDHWRAIRRLRRARLMDDPRYCEAVELLWERQETAGAFLDAIEQLVAHGIDRNEARRNLKRILGVDLETARLATGRTCPTPPAVKLANPWDRKQSPASSSAFIMPAGNLGRATPNPGLAIGQR